MHNTSLLKMWKVASVLTCWRYSNQIKIHQVILAVVSMFLEEYSMIRMRLGYFSIQDIENIDSDIRDSKLRLESACVCTYAKSAGFT